MDTGELKVEGFKCVTTDRGILKKVVKSGYSPFFPIYHENVVIHYIGMYQNGKKHGELFDSSRARDKPINFFVGFNSPIKVFDVVVKTMRQGEICEIIAYPDYTYYDDQVRRYVIELIDFFGLPINPQCPRDSFSTISPGDDMNVVFPGEKVEIRLKAYFREHLFDDRRIIYTYYDYEDARIPKIVNRALGHMPVGGEYRIKLVKPADFSTAKLEELGPPEDAILWYHIWVVSCEIREQFSKYQCHGDKLTDLMVLKNRANENAKVGKYEIADGIYEYLQVDICNYIGDPDFRKIYIVILQNRSLLHLKMRDPNSCIETCECALKQDPKNEKCLFRKGLAYIMKNDYNSAQACFTHVLKVNPNNVEAKKKFKLCQDIIKREESREKARFETALMDFGDEVFSVEMM